MNKQIFFINYTLFNLKMFSTIISNNQSLNIRYYSFNICSFFYFAIVFTNVDK